METWSRVLEKINDQTKPFTQKKIGKKSIIRIFEPNFPDHLYKWHQDPEDREIIVLTNSGWRFQFDNKIPFIINRGCKFKIPKGKYHRLIKGTSNLIIQINFI